MIFFIFKARSTANIGNKSDMQVLKHEYSLVFQRILNVGVYVELSLHTCARALCSTVLRSRSQWSRNYLRPGAGAEIVFFYIYCSQF